MSHAHTRPWLITRRSVLQAAGAGTLLAWTLPAKGYGSAAGDGELLRAYLSIDPDGTVVVTTPDAELGQGIYTTHALLIAEELGADWDRVRVRFSGAGEVFANPQKKLQATGRSMGTTGYYRLLREVGAMARAQLCEAAAARWQVPASECNTASHRVEHAASGRRLEFAELVAEAVRIAPPEQVRLRDASDFRLIGRSAPRLEIPLHAAGRSRYAVDLQLPGMKLAALKACPTFGGRLKSMNAAAAENMAGVHSVHALDDAVAVVADSWWEAQRALQQVKIEWEAGDAAEFDSQAMRERLKTLVTDRDAQGDGPARVAVESGDVDKALADSPRRIEGVYEVPYLAHATMEPMSCVARVDNGECELWSGTQGPMRARDTAAAKLAIAPERVTVHRCFSGGGFGRRWQPDFIERAVDVARRVPGIPVKLIFSREEDTRHDYYRPAYACGFEGSVDEGGEITALKVRVAGASLFEFGRPGAFGTRPDPSSVSGINDHPYRIGSALIDWSPLSTPVPIGVWRAVGHSQNGFFMESIIDELAHAAGLDPYEFRRALIDDERLRNVLDTVAKAAEWGTPLPEGHGRGIAIMEGYGSIVAQVAEVSVRDRRIKLQRMFSAIDCGMAVHPDNVHAQMEGGILFGLTAMVHGVIDIDAGAVRQGNFSDYPLLQLKDAPRFETVIIESGEKMGGVGEPGLPPAAPAVANAVFAACGERIRALPLSRHGWRLA